MSSCRILVVSSTIALGLAFIKHAKALNQGNTLSIQSEGPHGDYGMTPSEEIGGLRIVQWTLSNKYYTADVDFAVVDATDWRLRHAVGVPAVVFVWAEGEPFEETLRRVSDDMSRSAIEPEVCLAVCITPPDRTAVLNLSRKAYLAHEGADNVDEFISTCGFEYIDGTSDARAKDSDIPTFPRVIDALSTIMWPSMIQTPGHSSTQQQSRSRSLLSLDLTDERGLTALLRAAQTDAREEDDGITELERWLEEGEGEDNMLRRGEQDDLELPITHKTGFEDDFAAFVSAPAVQPSTASLENPMTRSADACSSIQASRTPSFTLTSATSRFSDPLPPDPDLSFGSTYDFGAPSPAASAKPTLVGDSDADPDEWTSKRITPTHTGKSWTSLHSISDIADPDHRRSDGWYTSLADDAERDSFGSEEGGDDPELPSQAEVRATSARIFGSGQASSSARPALSSPLVAAVVSASEDDEDYDPAFDLSRVLASLEGMKAEIAGMPDEDTRRRAAARVALGLVYGLGLEDRS